MENYPWFKNYPEEVPHKIDYTEYSSLVEILRKSFDAFADNEAFVNMGKSLTYKEVDDLSDDFASFLQEKGLNKGDRIAIQMPNLLQYPIALFGALKAGLIVVNTNPLYTPREMQHQFRDSEVTAIVILSNFAANLEKIIADTDIKTVIVTDIGDMLGGLKGSLVNFVVKYIKKMVPPYNLKDSIKFKDALKAGKDMKFTPVEIGPEDIVFLQYTGGTTGVSKGAVLTHRNICANILQCNKWFQGLEEKETVITALPLYHIFALTVNCLLLFSLGLRNILITNPRDMKSFLKDLKKYPFSFFTGVNTLYNGLLNQPDFVQLDFRKLKIAVSGAMALQKSIAEKWESVTGVPIVEGYGLSETSPVLTVNPQHRIKLGTIGIPIPSTELKIMNENGEEMPVGEPGEICARGPQVMKAYWKKEEETKNSFFGEWFRTGDVGVMNEDGYFKIVDRKKDMILVSGFNVYPNEIEDVVSSHPKVLEVAAIGVPDEKSNEAVKIFVVKKDESLTEHELETFCHENMTGYKRPKHIEFTTDLPKTNVGKILRRKLKE